MISHIISHKQKVFLINLIDFIPVIGSIKIIIEGMRGKQYGTHRVLTGIPKGIHTISGLSFLVLDMTTVGTIFSEFGKGVLKIGERVLIKSTEEVVMRDAVVHVASEVGIHELVKKESSVIIEKIQERTENHSELHT
jgi:hypothetical protein